MSARGLPAQILESVLGFHRRCKAACHLPSPNVEPRTGDIMISSQNQMARVQAPVLEPTQDERPLGPVGLLGAIHLGRLMTACRVL